MNHLSKQEQWKLICEYYKGTHVKDLIEKYKIDISISNFYLTLRLVETATQVCPYCKTHMFCIPPTKTGYPSSIKKYICKTCRHTVNCGECQCHNCFDSRQKIALEKRLNENLHQEYQADVHNGLISIDELSFKEKIYLGAMLREFPLTKKCIFTIPKGITNFAPSRVYSQYIVSFLINKGVVFQIETSKIGVQFAVNLKDICQNNRILYDLLYPEKNIELNPEILEIIREIQVYEAIEYFSLIAINKFSLEFVSQNEITEHFYELFVHILENDYATTQLFYFIYSALRNYAAESACSRTNLNAYSKIYNNILNLYKKAQQNNWQINGYRRQYITKPSALYKIMAFDILDIGEDLFQSDIVI